ncbi:MAG: hypothetical protein NVS2B16_30670 [Chloroflexota bacterium]
MTPLARQQIPCRSGEHSDRFSDREKIPLIYTSAIVRDAAIAPDSLWTQLHYDAESLSDPVLDLEV